MMRTRCRLIPIAFAALCAAVVSSEADGAARASRESSLSKPSENKGKTGTYQVKTSRDGCNYFVCVPKSYSEANPAGLHVYFHGQNGQNGAGGFGQWSAPFLERFNLIGINMQYMDGDNGKDTGGKTEAAVEAILQVMADYKIIPRRGVACSFSGGGLPHGGLVGKFCKRSSNLPSPFVHQALYGSNFFARAGASIPMSWFIGLGSEEWNMGMPTLGTTQPARFIELISETAKGGPRDVYLKITKGKGHSISAQDVADSAEQFRRADLAYCGFLYAADYREAELKSIVASANKLNLGSAAAAIDRLLASSSLSEELKTKAAGVKSKIDKRIDAVVALAAELAQNDPVLCTYYGPTLLKQLTGHAKLADANKAIAEARKDKRFSASMALYASFAKTADKFFNGPSLNAGAVPMLQKAKEVAGEKSLLGKMATEFLMLQ